MPMAMRTAMVEMDDTAIAHPDESSMCGSTAQSMVVTEAAHGSSDTEML